MDQIQTRTKKTKQLFIDISGSHIRIARIKKLKKIRNKISKLNKNKTTKLYPEFEIEEFNWQNWTKTKRTRTINHFLNKNSNLSNILISYAGIITKQNKKIKEIYLPNIDQTIRIPIKIISENDMNLVAYAHYEKKQTIVALGLGTGIGLGLVINGKPIKGNFGEIGHIIISNKSHYNTLEDILVKQFRTNTKWQDLTETQKKELLLLVAKLIYAINNTFFPDKFILHGALGQIIFKNRTKIKKILKKQIKNNKTSKYFKKYNLICSTEKDIFYGLLKLKKEFKDDN